MRYNDLQDIKTAVENNDGVLTITMMEVRDAYGAKKLGAIVRENIGKALAGMGIGHYPPELPQYQDQAVRLYKLGGAVSDLIDAVLVPSVGGDNTIRLAVSNNAADTVRRIRELVCE